MLRIHVVLCARQGRPAWLASATGAGERPLVRWCFHCNFPPALSAPYASVLFCRVA